MKLASTLSAVLLAAAPAVAGAQTPSADPHAGHAMEMQQAPRGSGAQGGTPADAQRNPNLPPTGDVQGADKNAWAKAQLSASPRHSEWVDIKATSGAPIKSFVVYPERKDKAPVVIVIQEIFGLTDWIRGVADQLAKEGFIAIAPDFMSGMGPNGGGSAELGEQGSTQVIGKLTP
ncbi:MAG TPA: dienelactone hydrolase family protein, partial [Vicinamibacterales bacterium]